MKSDVLYPLATCDEIDLPPTGVVASSMLCCIYGELGSKEVMDTEVME